MAYDGTTVVEIVAGKEALWGILSGTETCSHWAP